MLDFPSSSTIGSIAGTSVRSSRVVGRLRCDGGASAAGGREPNGTSVRGIIFLLSLARQRLLVGRAPHVPGCLPSPASPVPAPPVPRFHSYVARAACATLPETPP